VKTVRAIIPLFCIMLNACGGQPALSVAEVESSTAVVSSSWDCEKDGKSLWSCVPPAQSLNAASGKSDEALMLAERESPSRDWAAATPAPEPASAPQPVPAPEPVPTAVSATAPAAVGKTASDGAYVLQVGAFQQMETARKAATGINLEELRIITTRRGDETWYVLVLGAYHSRLEAREAGEAYLQAYPRGSIWVRSASDLTQSLISP
jgi:septal ring-binding cell division protein DamX